MKQCLAWFSFNFAKQWHTI